MDHNQHGGSGQGRRQHFHRGRRGSDRRGLDRRQPGAQPQQGGDESRRGGEHVDVEQLMREIRSRISQRHGIELSAQQVHDLAARRLEAILDVRTVDSSLLESMRKGAAAPPPAAAAPEPVVLDESAIFASDNALVRFLRALFKPIARLLFNVSPIVQAINTQTRAAAEAAARSAEREKRQNEWNALQYELLVRMVRETSRISLEIEALTLRIESLAGRVDFNERRVRSIEGTVQQPQGHRHQQPRPVESPVSVAAPADTEASNGEPGTGGADGQRRRRRRRRGRRGPGGDGAVAGSENSQQPSSPGSNDAEVDHAVPHVDAPAVEPPAPVVAAERTADEPAGDQ